MRMEYTREEREVFEKILERSHSVDEDIDRIQEVFEFLLERERVSYALTNKDFAEILGVTPGSYCATTKPLNNMKVFVRFCYVFGYDLNSVFTAIEARKKHEAAIEQTATVLSSLDCTQIEELTRLVDRYCNSLTERKRRSLSKALKTCLDFKQSSLDMAE